MARVPVLLARAPPARGGDLSLTAPLVRLTMPGGVGLEAQPDTYLGFPQFCHAEDSAIIDNILFQGIQPV